jgi:IS605 OrfB family transposase
MSHESKNVYNYTNFCTNIYYKFKDAIYERLYQQIITNQITTNNQFIDMLYVLYKEYYDYYVKNNGKIKELNASIYKFIMEKLDDIRITDTNYQLYYDELKAHFVAKPLSDQEEFQLETIKIMESILQSFYRSNFATVKNCLINKIPIDGCYEKNFIDHVRKQEPLFAFHGTNHFKNKINKRFSNNKFYYDLINAPTLMIVNSRLSSTYLTNSNYNEKYSELVNYLGKDPLVPNVLSQKYSMNIMMTHIQSIYLKNYDYVKTCLSNNIPINHIDLSFIENVRNKKSIVIIKPNDELIKKIVSDQTIIANFVYRNYDKSDRLPKDMIQNIIGKADGNYKSHQALKAHGKKSNVPKFLPFDGSYVIPFTEHLRKYIPENKTIRLCVGKYVAANLNDITGNDYIRLNSNKINHAKYASPSDMRTIASSNKIRKIDNFIVGDKFISKTDSKIIDATFIFVKKPPHIDYDAIKMIEIVPLNVIGKYKICFTYEKTYQLEEKKEDIISIDLGVKNIITIYDPKGKQMILKGGEIISLNNLYTYKIGLLQSKLIRSTNKNKIGDQINKLHLNRHHQIDNYFNQVVAWMATEYAHKSEIIIGYNRNWKTGSKIGKANRSFQQIPYMRLINKLRSKMETQNCKVVFTEESYTSKCDALALESIESHKHYMGNRSKRGLFKSSVDKLINADLNGAINIMRKWRIRNDKGDLKSIEGVNLCNPQKIPIRIGQKAKYYDVQFFVSNVMSVREYTEIYP